MIDSLGFLAHTRTLGCIVLGCSAKAVPHHRDTCGGKYKVPAEEHWSVIPICTVHHSQIENSGEARFEETYNINLDKEALRILKKYLWSFEAGYHDPATTAFCNRVIALYKESCPSLSHPRNVRGTRKRTLQARIRENPEFEYWEEFFAKVEASDFLTGRTPSETHPNFTADFDWIIDAHRHDKIMEDKYLNKITPNTRDMRDLDKGAGLVQYYEQSKESAAPDDVRRAAMQEAINGAKGAPK